MQSFLFTWVHFSSIWILGFLKINFWRRQWQPTPVLLPGKLHGRRSLAGYSPQGCKALDATEHDQWAHYNIYLTHEDFEAQTDGDLCFRPYHGEVGELEFEPLSFESEDILFIMPPPTVNWEEKSKKNFMAYSGLHSPTFPPFSLHSHLCLQNLSTPFRPTLNVAFPRKSSLLRWKDNLPISVATSASMATHLFLVLKTIVQTLIYSLL